MEHKTDDVKSQIEQKLPEALRKMVADGLMELSGDKAIITPKGRRALAAWDTGKAR